MKYFIFLFFVYVGYSLAAPQQLDSSTTPIAIIRDEREGPDSEGSYKYLYETANGINVEEEGYQKNKGTDEESSVKTGKYSYTSPEGELIEVTWIADENGFRAEGAHLPTPPPIPVEIQRALEFLASQPQTESPLSRN